MRQYFIQDIRTAPIWSAVITAFAVTTNPDSNPVQDENLSRHSRHNPPNASYISGHILTP